MTPAPTDVPRCNWCLEVGHQLPECPHALASFARTGRPAGTDPTTTTEDDKR